MTSPYKIVTWNCTSLFSEANDQILEKFLTTAKDENFDIICIQGHKKGSFHLKNGSKCHKSAAQKIAEYGFYVVDEEYECGVVTFFSSRMLETHKITRFYPEWIRESETKPKVYHECFHVLNVDLIVDLTLVNVYLPTADHIEQYKKLGETLSEIDTTAEIVVGDFNFHDKKPGNPSCMTPENKPTILAAMERHRRLKYDYMQWCHGLVLHETDGPTCGRFYPDLVYSNVKPVKCPTVLHGYQPGGYTHLHRPVLFEAHVDFVLARRPEFIKPITFHEKIEL